MFKFATLVLLLLIFATLVSAEQKVLITEMKLPKFIGYAYDIDTQELLYTELHQYQTPTLHEVQYKETDGEVFATKIINYQHSYFAPDFIQHNRRNGERIDIKRKNQRDGETNIKYLVQYQENTKEKLEKETISHSPRLIIDAGFDHFIMQNWQALNAGKEMTIDYLIPSLRDYYELTIKQETCKSNLEQKPQIKHQSHTESQHCFSISASSFFIALFSSQLELIYSKKTDSENNNRENNPENVRLIGFQGRSNISDSQGNYQDVNIVYRY